MKKKKNKPKSVKQTFLENADFFFTVFDKDGKMIQIKDLKELNFLEHK